MAATADPRAKPPAAASRQLKPWAPPRAHRVPSLPDVSGGGARDRRRSSSSHRRDAAEEKEGPRNDSRLEDLRAKLMGHLRDAADRLRLPAPPKPRSPSPQPEPEPKAPAAPLPLPTLLQQEAPAARPWNLRDRKRRPSARAAAAAATSSLPAAEKAPSDKRAPFAVALTAEEVEEDVYALTGARPRRRPRKRPRVVQRQLDVRPNPPYCPFWAPLGPLFLFSKTKKETRIFLSARLEPPPPLCLASSSTIIA
jgi:hypothetical protein